jgi:hypothetical protein
MAKLALNWTECEQLYASGMSCGQIGKAMGSSTSTIRQGFAKRNFSLRRAGNPTGKTGPKVNFREPQDNNDPRHLDNCRYIADFIAKRANDTDGLLALADVWIGTRKR